jgi:hypothetical protein
VQNSGNIYLIFLRFIFPDAYLFFYTLIFVSFVRFKADLAMRIHSLGQYSFFPPSVRAFTLAGRHCRTAEALIILVIMAMVDLPVDVSVKRMGTITLQFIK